MPLDSVSYRDIGGQNEVRSGKNMSVSQTQRRLNDIAASQAQKMPTSCGPFSLLLLGTLILANLRSVSCSPSFPPAAAPPRDPHSPGSTTAASTQAFPQAIATVSATLPPPGAPLFSHMAPHAEKKRMNNLSQSDLPFIRRTPREVVIPIAQGSSSKKMIELQQYDKETQMLIAHNPTAKILLFGLVSRILEKKGGIHESRFELIQNEWQQTAIEAPVVLAMTQVTHANSNNPDSVTVSGPVLQDQEEDEYCAYTTVIVDTQGHHQGNVIVTKVRGFDDRFGLFVNDTPDTESIAKPGEYLINVMTLGLDIAHSRPIARFYCDLIGTEYCDDLPQKGNVGTFYNTHAVEGLPSFPPPEPNAPKPQELEHLRPANHRFSLLTYNNQTGIQRGLILTTYDDHAPTKDKYVLLPTGDNTYQAHPFTAHKAGAGTQGFAVIYDQDTQVWRRAKEDRPHALPVHIEQDQPYISLYGDLYPLQNNTEGQYVIRVQSEDGKETHLPVSQTLLTNRWHLDILNGMPMFNEQQKILLRQLAISPSYRLRYRVSPNRAPQRYGEGLIFEVRQYRDKAASPPRYLVVEMGNMLVPVRMGIMEGHDVGYSIYDLKHPSRSGQRIEWYGGCWRLEPWTSAHVSSALSQQVSPDMFVQHLPNAQLSAPDAQGIMRENGQGYLKLRGHYVQIEKTDIYRVGPTDGKRIAVYYKDDQFFPTRAQHSDKVSPTPLADPLYAALIDLSNAGRHRGIHYANIQQAVAEIAKLAFAPTPPPSTQVTPIPATTLTHKRYRVTLDTHQLFIETRQAGDEVRVLTGNEHDIAMDKYHRGLADTDYPSVIALKHNRIPRIVEISSPTHRDTLVRQRIAAGTQLIKNILDQAIEQNSQEKTMIVGHGDFFHTSVLENDVFSSAENVYQALYDSLLPLSKAYPNAIIIPGSLYLSQDLPGDILHSHHQYQQGGAMRNVQNAVSCSAIVVPVLHRGELVTLTRKGEYLNYAAQDDVNAVTLYDLDTPIPDGATLNIANMKPVPDLDEWRNTRGGSIFAGKTLLPNERALVSRLFRSNTQDDNPDEMNACFSNEFVIDGTKFLLVVEDEFIKRDSTQPKVRSLAFPYQENSHDANHYDWIIHPAAGDPLDATLRSAGINYLYADFNKDSTFMSNTNLRMTIHSVYPGQDALSFYQFVHP